MTAQIFVEIHIWELYLKRSKMAPKQGFSTFKKNEVKMKNDISCGFFLRSIRFWKSASPKNVKFLNYGQKALGQSDLSIFYFFWIEIKDTLKTFDDFRNKQKII